MSVPEAIDWLEYAKANLSAAKLLLEAGYYNPCLQEAQQATEKALQTVNRDCGLKLPI